MHSGLVFYFVVQLVSLSVLPLTFRFFAQFQDRGYSLNKALGILLASLLFWLGTSYGLLRNEVGGAWLALLVLASAAAFVTFSRRGGWKLGSWVRSNYPIILVCELLFLGAFVGWALVRSYDPGIQHTEQPMDLMFMNAIWSSPTFPPRDPWLAGYAISYYYFGYWMLNTLGQLANLPPEITYNLGQACWYGLLLLGSFGIGYNLWARRLGKNVDKESMSTVAAYCCGLLSALLVGFMGNLQILLELAHSAGWHIQKLASWFDVHNFPPSAVDSGGDPWWWRASRVVQDSTWNGQHIEVIDEFPAFSYVLGDNHPHLLAMPFVLLAVGLGLNLFLARERSPRQEGPNPVSLAWRDILRFIPWGSPGLLFFIGCSGALFFLNSWDYPGGWLLLVLCLFSALRFSMDGADFLLHTLWTAILFGLILGVGAMLLYLPFLLTAQSQVTGIRANLLHPTHFPQFLLMFGAFLPGLGALIFLAWRERHPAIRSLVGTVLLVLGVPLLFLGSYLVFRPDDLTAGASDVAVHWLRQCVTFVVLGLILAVLISLLWERWVRTSRAPGVSEAESKPRDPALDFALLLSALALLLVFVPEWAYLGDNFKTRMNTVFKFYYQAWALLGISSAYVLLRSLRSSLLPRSLAALGMVLMGAGMLYTPAAVFTKTSGFGSLSPTVSALEHLSARDPDMGKVIVWVRQNVPPDAIVLEGKGESYRPDQNRISTYTGRATLLGWEGHELQWRGSSYSAQAEGRTQALETVYQKGTIQEIQETLREWDIRYVSLGPEERRRYGISEARLALLERALDPVFSAGAIRIYQRRGNLLRADSTLSGLER